jgi:hypothetical protein
MWKVPACFGEDGGVVKSKSGGSSLTGEEGLAKCPPSAGCLSLLDEGPACKLLWLRRAMCLRRKCNNGDHSSVLCIPEWYEVR